MASPRLRAPLVQTSFVLIILVATTDGSPLLPVLPYTIAEPGSWPAAGSAICGPSGRGAFCGDVRAVLSVSNDSIVSGVATAQIFWRRRDPHPELKRVIIIDPTGAPATVINAEVEATCGLLNFSATLAGEYHVYYLPFLQANDGAGTTFSWQGCNDTRSDEDNLCVLGRRRASTDTDVGTVSYCDARLAAASLVTRIESRDSFNLFTDMEAVAASAEVKATRDVLRAASRPFGVFPEDHDRAIRMFDAIPVRWTPGGEGPQPGVSPSLSISAAPGEFCVFQFGLWAHDSDVMNVTAVASDFAGPGASVINSTDVVFINLAGIDTGGRPYVRSYGVVAGRVGSLWTAVRVPADAELGTYAGTVTIATAGAVAANATTVSITVVVTGEPVTDGGAANVTSYARLQWLYSTRGLEDIVPAPFVPVAVDADGSLTLRSLLHNVTLAPNGMIEAVNATVQRWIRGSPGNTMHTLLASRVRFDVFAGGASSPLAENITQLASITSRLNSSVSWSAASLISIPGGGELNVDVTGTYDFTAYASFEITVSTAGSTGIVVDDVRLSLPIAKDMCGYIVGMDDAGAPASQYVDRKWRWSNTTGSNKVWIGRPEVGALLNLKGDGDEWNSPMFGRDYPVIPGVPNSWGGVEALPTGNMYGVNITACTMVAFTGGRRLDPGQSVVFRFDVALTPSKPVDWQRHWTTRAIQVGYGTPYLSPQVVASRGATAVTLHQGTPGIVNGSMVNPYINYPFLDDTVPLLTNYTQQANELGMLVRYYYTIRELSSRAVETFAFLAQQGEIFVDQDPYVIGEITGMRG